MTRKVCVRRTDVVNHWSGIIGTSNLNTFRRKFLHREQACSTLVLRRYVTGADSAVDRIERC